VLKRRVSTVKNHQPTSLPLPALRLRPVPLHAKRIDFYTIYVLPDTWYIFPVRALTGMRTTALTPHLEEYKY
jgi:hypothetical protein